MSPAAAAAAAATPLTSSSRPLKDTKARLQVNNPPVSSRHPPSPFQSPPRRRHSNSGSLHEQGVNAQQQQQQQQKQKNTKLATQIQNNNKVRQSKENASQAPSRGGGIPVTALLAATLARLSLTSTIRRTIPKAARTLARRWRRIPLFARLRLPSPPPLVPPPPPAIVWFRAHDLRIHDHAALRTACASHASAGVICVFVFEPEQQEQQQCNLPRQFLSEAVSDVRAALRRRGAELYVRHGDAPSVVAALASDVGASHVYYHRGAGEKTAGEEARLDTALRAGSSAATAVPLWHGTLHHVDDLPFPLKNVPGSYEAYAAAVSCAPIRAPEDAPANVPTAPASTLLPSGSLPDCRARASSSAPIVGGEVEGLRRLESYVRDALASPRGAAAASFASRIAPWLAAGCLSPRATLAAAVAQAGARENLAISRVTFELLWRDFFYMVTTSSGALTTPTKAP